MPVLKKEEVGTAEKANGEYPVVSVIIPVYNSEKYTEKCIRSLLGQTYRNLELLIIDDGSTDQSGAILDRLSGEDTRIRLIHQKNAGVAAARNRGIDLATGTYLTFVDGDDYVAPDYIQCLVDCARKNEAELVICGLQFVKEDGTCLKKVVPGTYRRFEQEEWTFRISAVCSHLYKKTLWDRWQIRFLSGERGEDMPISLFFSAICDKIVTLPEAGYFYVQHESSAMHRFAGLQNYMPPYRALEQAVHRVQEIGVQNSPEYYELFVLRILATCYFQLGRGASQERMHELCNYITRILRDNFPAYYKNPLTRLWTKMDVPFSQKAAVWILKNLVRTGFLYPVSRWIGK